MDKLKGILGGQLPEELKTLFPDGLPDLSEVQSAVDGLSQEELTQKATTALADVDQAKLTEFGSMMNQYAGQKGLSAPAGLQQGNAADIGSLLGGLMKGEGGLGGALQSMQDASGGGGILDSVMDTVTGGKFDLVSLLKNPQIMAILAPIVAGILKKS